MQVVLGKTCIYRQWVDVTSRLMAQSLRKAVAALVALCRSLGVSFTSSPSLFFFLFLNQHTY